MRQLTLFDFIEYEYDIPAEVSVLSLFDGMSCGMIAMLNAGMAVESYDAYEIDKYAVKTASHNFPLIRQHGDVFSADFSGYEGVDYVIGGSPCTYWSIAQKNNRETEASGMGWELLQQYGRAVREAKPKYFIYENNKSMSSAIRCSISEAFGFEPICINSALVSAQNRQRLYWVGRRNADGTYSKVDVEQPEDRGILLRDILENGTDLTSNDKSFALTATYDGATAGNTLERHQRSMVAEPVCMRYQRSEEAKRVRKQYEAGDVHHGFHELSELHPRTDGKTNTLSTVLKDNPICEPVCVGYRGRMENGGGQGTNTGLYAIPVEFEGIVPTKAVSCADGKVYTVYEVREGLITIKGKQYPIKLTDGFYVIREPTVSECKRLQTVPEWYDFSVVSNSQAYKMLGNGWTCDVISHLIRATRRRQHD